MGINLKDDAEGILDVDHFKWLFGRIVFSNGHLLLTAVLDDFLNPSFYLRKAAWDAQSKMSLKED